MAHPQHGRTRVQSRIGLPPTPGIAATDVVRLRADRTAALRDLVQAAFDAHRRELFSCALRTTRDREVAADLVQETFVRLVAALQAGRRPQLVRPWLYRVLTNLMVSRGRHVSVVQRWGRSLRPSEETASPPDRAAIANETLRDLERAIGQLAPDARAALMLAAKGFTGPEIADQLSRSQAATRTLLCRTRMQVRAVLQQDDGDA